MRARLNQIAEQTQADELIIAGAVHDRNGAEAELSELLAGGNLIGLSLTFPCFVTGTQASSNFSSNPA